MKNTPQQTLAYSLMHSALLWATSLLPWVSLTALQHVKFCSPAGCQTVRRSRNTRPRALWLLLTECHDPELSALALTGGFEIPGLKVLWDYISEGICDDASWQVLLSSTWRNSAGCRSCRELRTIEDAERKCCFIRNFFNRLNCFRTAVSKLYTWLTWHDPTCWHLQLGTRICVQYIYSHKSYLYLHVHFPVIKVCMIYYVWKDSFSHCRFVYDDFRLGNLALFPEMKHSLPCLTNSEHSTHSLTAMTADFFLFPFSSFLST